MKYKFQHFVDISTSAETMQVLTFNVGGKDVIQRCAHLFNAYKYFKLGKISVKFVPASTLPVDPLGMSYDDTDPQTVDPRDQLNPGLVRITNGEDLMVDLGGTDDTQQEGMYQAMMLDPKWYKFNLQSGFKRTAVPLYWQIGQLHQDAFPGANINVPVFDGVANQINTGKFSMVASNVDDTYGELGVHFDNNYSSAVGIFQTGHRGRLGYLPTDMYQYLYFPNSTSASGFKPLVHPVPSIQTITCVLPKAHKTLYYYRVYITEEVYFSGLRSIAPTVGEGNNLTYRGINDFIAAPNIRAYAPSTSYTPAPIPGSSPMNDGTDAREV